MTTPPFPDDDPLAARLRDALHTEAHMVQTSDDALQDIQSRTAGNDRPWWRHPGALAVAAAAVLGVAAGGAAVLAGGEDEAGNVVAGQKSSSSETPTSPESTSPQETPTSAAPVPVEGDVYVYYVRLEGRFGARLYREERSNPGADPVTAALTTMFSEPALDPDYDSSSWPDGTRMTSYTVRGDTSTVGLSVPDGTDWEDVAVQQLVYTVTANDPSVQRVEIAVNGESLGAAIPRAPMVDVQGLIWLLGPSEGASVSSPVDITGFGTAFEGTISWEVLRAGSDQVVADGFTNGGANGEFAEFTDTVELPPGSYEMRAFESSAEDGRPLHVDTKTFTVE